MVEVCDPKPFRKVLGAVYSGVGATALTASSSSLKVKI